MTCSFSRSSPRRHFECREDTGDEFEIWRTVCPRKRKRNNQSYRQNTKRMYLLFLVLLVVFGWSGIIPAIHLMSVYGVTLVMRQVAMGWMALMCFLYTASAITYATRIPERFFPGKCDIWVSRKFSFNPRNAHLRNKSTFQFRL